MSANERTKMETRYRLHLLQHGLHLLARSLKPERVSLREEMDFFREIAIEVRRDRRIDLQDTLSDQLERMWSLLELLRDSSGEYDADEQTTVANGCLSAAAFLKKVTKVRTPRKSK